MEAVIRTILDQNIENELVEFKEASKQFDTNKLGKYFSALSNEANLKGKNCAWLLFGIKDDKKVVGSHISEKQLNFYKEEIAKNTSPRLTFTEIHKLEIEGKKIVALEIPPAPRGIPVAWKNHFYGRDGESLNGLNLLEIEQIRNQARSIDWSAQVIPTASIEDLSSEAIQKARIQFVEKNPALATQIEQWSDQVFLNKARITINGKITNAAIILLGKPESEHYISPATAKISWILRDKDNIEKDYEHFTCPLFLNVENIYSKIRNLKYRYLQDGTLFPDEVDQYDPYIIREGLHNCIAHQDYEMGGKINIIEREDGVLIFTNLGNFIPRSVEEVIESDSPESQYRNPFLANAMVNLNMIDTVGSGIKRMFIIQKDKYFPLPEYDLSNSRVKVTITGKIIDLEYARRLAQVPDLRLDQIILLDKVAKQKRLQKEEVRYLKAKGLIEGRSPNFHISSEVARQSDQKDKYIKLRGIDNDYIQKIILDYLREFGEAKRSDLEEVLMSKISEGLDISQKRNKIKNNLQVLKRAGVIEVEGKLWKMSKTEN